MLCNGVPPPSMAIVRAAGPERKTVAVAQKANDLAHRANHPTKEWL